MGEHYLKRLFAPQSVAVFGASDEPGAVGTLLLANLRQGFSGQVYAINPKHEKVQGQPCYPSLEAAGHAVDLAVIATPAATVPGIIEALGRFGVPGAVILSAGFSEAGEKGRKLERELLEVARRHGVRLVGPNCLGIMRPSIGLNATFAHGAAKAGKLALVSQSGAICTAVLDWAAEREIGFSSVVSTGLSADVDFGEVLDYLVADPETESILLYIEGVRNARGFMSGLRAAARSKPVIALKVGRHDAGGEAARSHTAALVGNDEAFSAALRRAGVVRGRRIGYLFAAASTLAAGYRYRGRRLCIVTNGGGPGAMAADEAAELGIPLAELDEATRQRLDEALPTAWSHGNPVDIVGDAPPERYAAAIEACLASSAVDAMLVILTPQAMTDPAAAARALIKVCKKRSKPVFACWMGGVQVAPARELLESARIPSFNTPETAVEAFKYLASYHENQRLLLQVPGALSRTDAPDIEGARMIIEGVLAEGRKLLSEQESKALLAAFRIPVVAGTRVHDANEALVAAETLGFPVALKIDSPDITHKSDVGGVQLNITNMQALRPAFLEMMQRVGEKNPEARLQGAVVERMVHASNARELLVGITTDPIFGPVVSFGSGGKMVEALADTAVALPPLNTLLADDLIRRTGVSRMLGDYRDMPAADLEALRQVLVRVAEIACELPEVRELDINPLLLDEHGAVAVDARVVVGHPPLSLERYDHMAIHPYPRHFVQQMQLPDGTPMTIRPIRPEDAGIEQSFVRALSRHSKYYRFMYVLDELPPEMLARFTQLDYDREMAFIAVVSKGGEETEVAVARYITNPDGESCEFAVAVADDWQHHGIGHRLMEALMAAARSKGLKQMEGAVLSENREMLQMAESLGFSARADAEDASVTLVHKWL
jgi:acetyltransferase